jgi:hypothetical protein
MKLIDKEKVETILRNLWKQDDGHNSEHRICYNKALQEVQCEIDILETKEMDLEQEIKNSIDSLSNLYCYMEDLLFFSYSAGFFFITLGLGVLYAIVDDFVCKHILKSNDEKDEVDEDDND